MERIALDPMSGSFLTIKLYKTVQNVKELRKKVMSGQLECCFVNPKLILDPFQLIVAANKSVSIQNVTKSVFTEILYNLSISKNITKSLQQFGITDQTQDLLVLTVGKNSTDDFSHIYKQIKGEEVDLEILREINDLTAIKKVYKIGAVEEKNSTLLNSVVSKIATKDFIAH